MAGSFYFATVGFILWLHVLTYNTAGTPVHVAGELVILQLLKVLLF
jgi:hypothetical protein